MTDKKITDLIPLYNIPEIQGRRGEWQVGDAYYCPRQAESEGHDGIKWIQDGDYIGLSDDYGPCCPDVVIWLPLPIDPVNPERGLIHMAGTCTIDYVNEMEVYLHGAYEIYAENITLALLIYINKIEEEKL